MGWNFTPEFFGWGIYASWLKSILVFLLVGDYFWLFRGCKDRKINCMSRCRLTIVAACLIAGYLFEAISLVLPLRLEPDVVLSEFSKFFE